MVRLFKLYIFPVNPRSTSQTSPGFIFTKYGQNFLFNIPWTDNIQDIIISHLIHSSIAACYAICNGCLTKIFQLELDIQIIFKYIEFLFFDHRHFTNLDFARGF